MSLENCWGDKTGFAETSGHQDLLNEAIANASYGESKTWTETLDDLKEDLTEKM
jgi:hypothetical protein